MPTVIGIDVGVVLHRPTSGVCRSGDQGFLVGHTYADKLSRAETLALKGPVDVLAIDGPVLPSGVLDDRVRAVEKVFLWGAFIPRCRIGDTRHGIGAALRRGGCDTAEQFADVTLGSTCTTRYPQVQPGRHVVEAFPNAMLGVTLPDECFPKTPLAVKRGGRFDWLLERWRERGGVEKLQGAIDWPDDDLWRELAENTHHEEQAGLLCAATAACVSTGRYTAVGEPTVGYLFLPPWRLWADWAKAAVNRNRRDPRLPQPVDVWIDGERFAAEDALPA